MVSFRRSVSIIAAILAVMMMSGVQGCMRRPPAPHNLRVIFTSDTLGFVTPCGSHEGLRGGMARRSTAIRNAIDSAPGEVILVDTGNFTTGSTDELELLRIDYVTRAMSEIGYDAVNVGLMDALRDRDVLMDISNHGVPLTSAGYTHTNEETGEEELSYPERIIVERDEFPIAIVGSHLSDTAGELPLGKGNEPTVTGLDLYKMIQDFYTIDGVGMVILISDMADDRQQVNITASIFPLVTVMIAGEPAEPDYTEDKTGEEVNHPVTIPHAATWGCTVGILDLELSRSGGVTAYHLEYVDLTDEIEDDPELGEMIGEYVDALSTPPASIDEIDTSVYAGPGACMECHPSEYVEWMSSPHSAAWETLEASPALDIPTCVPCHISGYTEIEWLPMDLVPESLVNVGCESCHGPGREHIAFRSGAGDGATDTIVLRPPERACVACHVAPWDHAWLYYVKYDRVRHGSD